MREVALDLVAPAPAVVDADLEAEKSVTPRPVSDFLSLTVCEPVPRPMVVAR